MSPSGTAAGDPSTPDVSVVTVTWNSAAVIERFLASLPAAFTSRTWELIIVDNASSDATLTIVRSSSPDATVVANAKNLGLAAANNQGILAARARYVAISNPDVIFRPGAIEAMADLLERRPSAGWVVPRLLYEDGSVQASAGRLPTLADALLGRTLARWRSSTGPTGFWWDGWAHDEERQIERGHEASYMVRREAVERVGLQDERFVLDWEGPDWTDRFQRAGWEVWLAPAAEVVHLGGASVRQVPLRWILSTHRGMYYYFSDRRSGAWKPLLAAAFAARGGLKAAAVSAGLPIYQWAHRGGQSNVGTRQ